MIRIACAPAEYPATLSMSRSRPWIHAYSIFSQTLVTIIPKGYVLSVKASAA